MVEWDPTTSDERIAIFTEWLDEAGRLLPSELGKRRGEAFGLLGQLARLGEAGLEVVNAGHGVGEGGEGVQPGDLDMETVATGNLVVDFGIPPGRSIQLVRLKGDSSQFPMMSISMKRRK